ncbi:FecR family protein [Stenotrophomonas acidaminiphila]
MNNQDGLSRQRIVEQAAEWVVRLQDEDLSYEQIEQWNQWMEASAEHARAFDDVSLMWQAAARLPEDLLPPSRLARGEGAAGAMQARARPSVAPRAGRRRWLRWAAAAAVACVGLGLGAVRLFEREGGAAADAVQVYATARGERGHYVLADRSQVDLGPGSQLRVQIGPARRQLELVAGQAYFSVARDAARPFEVRAGGLIAQALGTRFAVEQRASGVAVTVTEGHVQVNDLSPDTGGRRTVQLVAGQKTALGAGGGLSAPHAVDARDALAWMDGSVVYAGEPLGNVIADLNRYSPIPVALGDGALAGRPVTGRWSTGDVDAWLEGMARAFSLDVVRSPDRIVLERRAGETGR